LAHYVGGGINEVLEMYVDDFFEYLDAVIVQRDEEIKNPTRVVLSGIEKK
jgi:hypothetical protein